MLIALALALLSADRGFLVPDDPAGWASLYRDDAEFPRSVCLTHYRVVHEAEGCVELDRAEASFREVVVDGEAGTITILGGVPTRRFREAVARAPSVPVAERDRELVIRGLGSRRWPTRQAASRILVSRGEAAIPVLCWGSAHSRDAEVVARCQSALEAIRTGRGE